MVPAKGTFWRFAALALLASAAVGLAALPRSAVAQMKPAIMSIGTTGCVSPGDKIKVRGRNLGSAGGLQLVLRDPNVVVALPVSSWTNRVISATVPKKGVLEPGKWYVLGIQTARSGRWLSGQGRPVQICANQGLSASDTLTATPPSGDKPDSKQPNDGPQNRPERDDRPSRDLDTRQTGGDAARPNRLLPPGPAAPTPAPSAQPGAVADPTIIPDEVLAITATLNDATTLAQQLSNQGYTVRALQELPTLGFALIRLGVPNGTDVPGALDALRQGFPTTLFDANTLYEPDTSALSPGAGINEAAATPRHYAQKLIGWPGVDGDCAAAVPIGLIDTAVDTAHDAFAVSTIVARSFIAGGVPPAPPDHGTAVAALLVGTPGSQSSGLLPAARLYAAAIFSVKEDDRIVGTTDAIARSVDWLGQQGVRVVNLSLSGPGNQVMRLTVDRAYQNGMVLVAAAGNEGPNAAPVFPAGYPAVIAVTAVDASLQPYRDANRGDYIDLAAPGVDVWSARGGEGGRYNTGTSFAAPFVSAAAALAFNGRPDTGPTDIRQSLREIARDLGSPGRDSTFGWGLLQPPGSC